MDEQDRVAAFLDRHDLESDPEFRVLDLVSEVGEIAKGANVSTGYGDDREALDVARDELGDALFSLLSVCEALDVDAGEALAEALDKYETRMAESGDPGSGE
ncbi:MazG nucleotide pyrophosphohydrolase domain-containing protein [Halorarum salinum]|uniref:Nucleotide pyrophosphohydrolase n=1 Tax=Halorarum salinum TaxID=2743089 RepID=A0A7D5L8U1_9EURY|nr:MazG-like family protein [Halobaculum salinum]QLG60607.1 nucleotide pyrophosphohydrolase [Halobaculum salinum]